MPVVSKLTPERVREICDRLLAEQDALKAFSASLEQEFLDLGSLLRNIASISRELQHQSDDSRTVTLGTPPGCPVEFAYRLLDKAADLAKSSREQYAYLASTFETFRTELTEIARDRDALLGTVARMNLGNAQFRIEASYLDATTRAQMFALADAATELLSSLQIKLSIRFEELGALLCTTSALATRFNDTLKVRAKSTEESLRVDQDDLTALNDALLRSQGFASINLRGRLNIAGGVRRAMVALQCQDITRQKIEHITAGMSEMVSHLIPGSSRKFTTEEDVDCKHYLGDAGRVQLAQLRATFEQLFEAAREVGGALEQVASEMDAGAHASLQSRKALLENQIFIKGLASPAAVFGMVAAARSDQQEALAVSKRLKTAFTDCATDLPPLTGQLHAIAGITQTFAGSAEVRPSLRAVTQEQRLLIDLAISLVHRMAPRAGSLVDSVQLLEQRLLTGADLSTSEWTDLDNNANASKVTLASIKQQLNDVVIAIRPLENDLSTVVQSAQNRIRFPQAVAEISARSTVLFEKLIGEYQLDAGNRLGPHEKVSELKRHYTMVGEHTVHDESVGSESVLTQNANEKTVVLFEDEPASESSESAQEEELADNVELF